VSVGREAREDWAGSMEAARVKRLITRGSIRRLWHCKNGAVGSLWVACRVQPAAVAVHMASL
jgi:hypothetical protein